LTVAVAGEVQNALSATKQLTSAFSSYNDMAKGGDHRPPSKELAEKFASL